MLEALNPSLQSADHTRRRFIKQSLSGGLVAAIATGQPILANQATAEGCGLPSKSDWLVTGLAFVTEVSVDAYEKIVTETVGRLTTYKKAFDELYCLLKALGVELAKSPTSAKATIDHMLTLTQVGRANSGFVNAAFREEANPAALFFTLALVSDEICAQAQNIAAYGKEWTLTKEASGILKKILELVGSKRFEDLHKGVVATQDSSSVAREAINGLLSTVHLAVAAARVAVLLAENPNPKNELGDPIVVNKAAQWTIADEQLIVAIKALTTMVNDKRVSSRLSEPFRRALPDSLMNKDEVAKAVMQALTPDFSGFLPATDSLILGLGNCRREIASELTAAISGDQEFRFMKASYAAAPVIDRTAMGNLLWAFCPPGSRDQIDKVDSMISFVGGWSIWLPQRAREGLIGSTLYWANKLQRLTCSGSKNLGRLAAGLATLR